MTEFLTGLFTAYAIASKLHRVDAIHMLQPNVSDWVKSDPVVSNFHKVHTSSKQ